MAQWIVRTKGTYPHLLPHLVDAVVSKKWLGPGQMDWLVEMSEAEAEAIRRRAFVESIHQAEHGKVQ